jgi:hypothetical protein
MSKLLQVVSLSMVLLGQAGGFAGVLNEFTSEGAASDVRKPSRRVIDDKKKDSSSYMTGVLEAAALATVIVAAGSTYYLRNQKNLYGL